MLRLWKWYQNCLAVHPVKTQMISSGVIWGFGDIAAQSITHYTAKKHHQIKIVSSLLLRRFKIPGRQTLQTFQGKIGPRYGPVFYIRGQVIAYNCLIFHEFALQLTQLSTKPITSFTNVVIALEQEEELKINWKRVTATSLFGFAFVGPVGHFWYEGLDRVIRSRFLLRPNSLRFVATKVAVDGFIFGPLDLLVFFTYMGFASGKSVSVIKEDVKRDFLPAFILEGGIWPVVQVANFRFVPVRYQLLYVNFFCLLDSCFLSWLEQQEDAPWKQWLVSFLPAKEKKDEGG